MADESSKLWNLALVPSLLLLAGVLYYRFEPIRERVDAKCPWIKEQLAKQGISLGEAAATPPEPTPARPRELTPAPPREPAPVQPRATAPAQPISLAQIAANQSLWPKTVRIKKATEFPAVHNGKTVGKLNAPAGTEVKLISVTAEKVGVAFSPDGTMSNAGGAWLLAAETDLLEQAQNRR